MAPEWSFATGGGPPARRASVASRPRPGYTGATSAQPRAMHGAMLESAARRFPVFHRAQKNSGAFAPLSVTKPRPQSVRGRHVDLVDAMQPAVAGCDVRRGQARAIDGHLDAVEHDRSRLATKHLDVRHLAYVRRVGATGEQVVVDQRHEFILVLGLH